MSNVLVISMWASRTLGLRIWDPQLSHEAISTFSLPIPGDSVLCALFLPHLPFPSTNRVFPSTLPNAGCPTLLLFIEDFSLEYYMTFSLSYRVMVYHNGQSGWFYLSLSLERNQGPTARWDQRKTVRWAKLALVLECFICRLPKGLLKKESPVAGRNAIKSPFPCVRKFGKGEAKYEDAGKGNKCGIGREGTQQGTGSQRPWRGKEGKAGIANEAKNESKHGLRAKCSHMTGSLSLCPRALSFSSLRTVSTPGTSQTRLGNRIMWKAYANTDCGSQGNKAPVFSPSYSWCELAWETLICGL